MSSASQVGPSPFFRRRDDPTTARLLEGLAASVGLHLAVAALAWAASLLGWFFAAARPHDSKVELVTMTKQQWEQHRELGAPPKPLSTPPKVAHPDQEKEIVKPTPLPKGQIVDVAGGNDEKPIDPKYLSEHDNTVAKQTRARETALDYGKAAPHAMTEKPLPPDAKTAPNHSPIDKGTASIAGGTAHPATDAARAVQAQKAVQADKLVPTPAGDITTPKDAQRVVGSAARLAQAGTTEAPQPTPGPEGSRPALLTPSVAALGEMTGAAAPDDLSGVDVGDSTFLNTQAFKYAGFFNRVKQRVAEQWNPHAVIAHRDPHGRLVGGVSRVTMVSVVLDSHGELRGVSVAKTSGLDFLDEEAVAAFERAAPFLNPPAGLLDGNGMMSFAFGFHLDDTPSGAGFRFR